MYWESISGSARTVRDGFLFIDVEFVTAFAALVFSIDVQHVLGIKVGFCSAHLARYPILFFSRTKTDGNRVASQSDRFCIQQQIKGHRCVRVDLRSALSAQESLIDSSNSEFIGKAA
jgi:hypothetical protein